MDRSGKIYALERDRTRLNELIKSARRKLDEAARCRKWEIVAEAQNILARLVSEAVPGSTPNSESVAHAAMRAETFEE